MCDTIQQCGTCPWQVDNRLTNVPHGTGDFFKAVGENRTRSWIYRTLGLSMYSETPEGGNPEPMLCHHSQCRYKDDVFCAGWIKAQSAEFQAVLPKAEVRGEQHVSIWDFNF